MLISIYYPTIRDQMIKSGEIKDPQHLTSQENQEIQGTIDNKVRSIGMTLLRGMTIPNPVGQILVDKALTDAHKLLHNTNK